MSAEKVSGDSQIPEMRSSRPASIRLAMAISPSRDSSSTDPISRRYMRTGSSVRPTSSSLMLPVGLATSVDSSLSSSSESASALSPSATVTPASDSCAITSSIWSLLT